MSDVEVQVSTSQPRRRRSWLFYLFGVPTVIILILAFLINAYGFVTGVEFSPESFQRRAFQYYEMPGVQWQIASVKHKDMPVATITYLRQNGFLPATTGEPRWDLVSSRRGSNNPGHQGDAEILMEFLTTRDESNQYTWITWTKRAKLPQSKFFWSAVAKVCRQDLYIMLPDMFAIALERGDQPLTQDLNKFLVQRYTELGLIKQKIGDHQRAAELFDFALAIDANYELAIEGRKRSLQ